jgi:pumilio RNA-binding family
MLRMSRHKFASNVCEKILVTADSESRRILIEELMTPKQDGVSPILTMMKDQFASTFYRSKLRAIVVNLSRYPDYVLQRALSVAEGQQKEDLINNVKPQLAYMRRFSGAYSKHLILSWCSYLLQLHLPDCGS